MKIKFKELLTFPCPFTYKVIGLAHPKLVDQVVTVVQRYAPDNYYPQIKSSIKGSYYSVSITIKARHINQIESLYEALGRLESVRFVL